MGIICQRLNLSQGAPGPSLLPPPDLHSLPYGRMTMRKPKGRWTDEEDRLLKSGSIAKRPVKDVAKALNRLEESVIIRAIVIGFPFADA